jgi:hypothetical protein
VERVKNEPKQKRAKIEKSQSGTSQRRAGRDKRHIDQAALIRPGDRRGSTASTAASKRNRRNGTAETEVQKGFEQEET